MIENLKIALMAIGVILLLAIVLLLNSWLLAICLTAVIGAHFSVLQGFDIIVIFAILGSSWRGIKKEAD